jgi:hypothetical protein
MQCWQDIAQFQQFLQCMLSQAGPIPMQGVTDGSDAKAGYIGEYLIFNGSMAFAANPAVTQQVLSVGVIPPGDWNLTSFMTANVAVGNAGFNLSPQPPGLSNIMHGAIWFGAVATQTAQDIAFNGQNARASVTVPTLLPFMVTVGQNTDAALTAGTATLTVEARRMR